MSKQDYYAILGIAKNCSEDELKKAYRKQAVQYHPDRNQGNAEAEEKFKKINEAYQILSDPEKRRIYDQVGHAAFTSGGFGNASAGGGPGAGFGGFSDIFDLFGDFFGAGVGSQQGVDLNYTMDLSFEEAAFGAEKEIHFDRDITCNTCQGSGAKPGTQPIVCRGCGGSGQVRFNQGFFTMARTCPQCRGRGNVIEEKCKPCRGSGRIKKEAKVTVKVPAGIDTNQRLRLRGEGEVGEDGQRPGDLYVLIRVREHSLFQRQNEDILLDFPISFVQAAVGCELDVPTLGGATKLRIQSGTQNGEVLRLRGKGIKRLNGTGIGDQLIRILIEVPKSLTARQRELLLEFEKESSQDSQPIIQGFLRKFKDLFQS